MYVKIFKLALVALSLFIRFLYHRKVIMTKQLASKQQHYCGWYNFVAFYRMENGITYGTPMLSYA